jgi:hypothetical protein
MYLQHARLRILITFTYYTNNEAKKWTDGSRETGDMEDTGMFHLENEGARWSQNICIQYSIDMSEESSLKFFALLR